MDKTEIASRKRRFADLPTTATSLGLRLHSVGEGFWHARRSREFARFHPQQVHRAILLTGGGGWLSVPGHPRQDVQPGQLCWIPFGSRASYRPYADGWWIERWISCSGASPDHWITTGVLPDNPTVVAAPASEAAFDDALSRCQQEDYPAAALAALGILHALASAAAAPPPRRHPVHDQIARIRADPAREWDLDRLATEAHLGRDGLRKAFIRICGQPPVGFIASCRLDLARQYLLDGAAVTEAARASGFHDAGYFSRRFRRAYGLAPSRMRDRAGEA